MESGTLHNQSSPRKQADYANGIDFWRNRLGCSWQQLANDVKVSLPVLRRTAKTHYSVYVNPQTGENMAVPVTRKQAGVLATAKLDQVAAALKTDIISLLDSPENLKKIYPDITHIGK